MATYRLFSTSKLNPLREFEGDALVQNGQFVQILAGDEARRIVAAFNLEPGQYVAEASTVRNVQRL